MAEPVPRRIAVVDDDPAMRKLIGFWLAQAGHVAVPFERGAAAIEGVDRSIAAVCLDLGLDIDDIPGMKVLGRLTAMHPDIPIVVVTAQIAVEAVVEAMRSGAYDYLAKPLDALRFEQTVRRAVEHHAMKSRMRRLESVVGERTLVDTLAAQSTAMREVMRAVEQVRGVDVNVAIMGESGTGKEVVARAIHDGGSSTTNGAFVGVNCASIPAAIQESELFGHEKGAFTGALATHRGKFEQAAGGTLFLDEIGEMAPGTQASLLRVLQERVIVRVGGRTEIGVNARVICATHRDLAAEVRAGRFREDLYFRLVVYPIRLPALRERPEDLPLLVAELLRRSRIARDRGIRAVSAEALEGLSNYRWPGNVRELDNVLSRACLACDGTELAERHLPPEIRGASRRGGPLSPRPRTKAEPPSARGVDVPTKTLRAIEQAAVRQALDACGGNISAAAKLLGVSRTKLYRDLRSGG
jgi:DNA-binding NtrC family response regulator